MERPSATTDEREPSLRACLAYTVLGDYETWLGCPSPTCLAGFLGGATTRAALVGQAMPTWRVYGPLELPEFYMPLVARTGHPTLSIKWATAMELHHFSLSDAMHELRKRMEDWVRTRGLPLDEEPVPGFVDPAGIHGLLAKLARRPGMYLGAPSSWALRCFLAGMDSGGDWLALPPLPGLRAIVDGLEDASEAAYGSKFAAFRVYENDPSKLLEWVGVVPE